MVRKWVRQIQGSKNSNWILKLVRDIKLATQKHIIHKAPSAPSHQITSICVGHWPKRVTLQRCEQKKILGKIRQYNDFLCILNSNIFRVSVWLLDSRQKLRQSLDYLHLIMLPKGGHEIMQLFPRKSKECSF